MSLDLDAIKARLAAACPGPWTGMTVKRFIDGDCLAIVREHPEGSHTSEKGTTLTIAATLVPQYGDNATATMLLHSRADMDALVAEVEALRAEVADLRMEKNEHVIDNMHAYEEGVAEGECRERAAVVAWLREEPERLVECDGHRHADGKPCLVMSPMPADELADCIERGQHRREEEP